MEVTPTPMFEEDLERFALGTALLIGWEILAVLTIINVVMSARSAAGAWGWAMAMIALPFVAVPLYWILGRQQFKGYISSFREAQTINEKAFDQLEATLSPHFAKLDRDESRYGEVLLKLSERRWTEGNEVCLLIDGEETFDAIFREIEAATDYVLIQFFVVRADQLGNRLREVLETKSRAGVRVYFIYDEIGSHSLPKAF
ncbi:MAG: PLDc N-terminal domain-containing protein, partial [Verrucomicrobiota bacterium]